MIDVKFVVFSKAVFLSFGLFFSYFYAFANKILVRFSHYLFNRYIILQVGLKQNWRNFIGNTDAFKILVTEAEIIPVWVKLSCFKLKLTLKAQNFSFNIKIRYKRKDTLVAWYSFIKNRQLLHESFATFVKLMICKILRK